MSLTTNTLAGPDGLAFWDLIKDRELQFGWTETWGLDTGDGKKRWWYYRGKKYIFHMTATATRSLARGDQAKWGAAEGVIAGYGGLEERRVRSCVGPSVRVVLL